MGRKPADAWSFSMGQLLPGRDHREVVLKRALPHLLPGRYRTCTVDNITSALVDGVTADTDALREKVHKGLEVLRQQGWVAADGLGLGRETGTIRGAARAMLTRGAEV